MTEVISIIASGLKCDNPSCDYINEDIPQEEYINYINAKCPKCGSVLLTQEDYDAMQEFHNLVAELNKLDLPVTEDKFIMDIESDGKGNLTFKEKE